MADRMFARIIIGGLITQAQREELAGHCEDNGLTLDDFDGADVLAAIESCIADGSTLSLHDEDACNGKFDDLEAWLRENGIAYRRRTEDAYEFENEIVLFDGEKKRWCYAMKGDTPLVGADDIRRAHENGTIDELLDFMARMAGNGFPPLSAAP